jgi:hypothetical protein
MTRSHLFPQHYSVTPLMSRPIIPFTETGLKRAIRAARKTGLRVTGIRPDGTLLVEEPTLAAESSIEQNPPVPQSDAWIGDLEV